MIAAVLTPPDVISQLSLAMPLMLLYEGSIWSVRLVEKKAAADKRQGRRQRRRQAGGVMHVIAVTARGVIARAGGRSGIHRPWIGHDLS